MMMITILIYKYIIINNNLILTLGIYIYIFFIFKIYINAKTRFLSGGSTQPNRSFDHDLECRDLHAFGNLGL